MPKKRWVLDESGAVFKEAEEGIPVPEPAVPHDPEVARRRMGELRARRKSATKKGEG